jgi:hypothetical protein
MSALNPVVAPKFYCNVFDMEIVRETDDTISLARLKYNADKLAGMNKHAKYIKHTDFCADNFEKRSEKLRKAAVRTFMNSRVRKSRYAIR